MIIHQELQGKCLKALERIFTLCDKDRDGLLNEKELQAFHVLIVFILYDLLQKKCFGIGLSEDDIIKIKDAVK